MSGFAVDSVFEVAGVDRSNYDHVSRLTCRDGTLAIEMDIHSGVFPVRTGTRLHIVLCDTVREVELLDSCEYCMRGRVFEVGAGGVYISFGGLLMKLQGRAWPTLPAGKMVSFLVKK